MWVTLFFRTGLGPQELVSCLPNGSLEFRERTVLNGTNGISQLIVIETRAEALSFFKINRVAVHVGKGLECHMFDAATKCFHGFVFSLT